LFGTLSKLIWALLVGTTATQCLPIAVRALLDVTRQQVQESRGNSAIGALVSDGLSRKVDALETASDALELPPANTKSLDGLRPPELRTLEIVLCHKHAGVAEL
jgi:hypothetical protein